MRVYISNYRDHWYSPYTWIDYAFFWTDWSKCSRNRNIIIDENYIEHPEWVEKVADFLTPISVAIQEFLDFVRPRVVDVKIDYWDTWSMDSTLAPIILPMLKQLRDTKHGSPMVDMEDVPEYMRTTTTEDWDAQKVFDFYREEEPEGYDIHKRWDWVLNEMIFAFEHIVDETWEEAFRSGEIDFKFVPCENNPKFSTMEDGPNHTYKCDYDGLKKVYDRIDNGLRLFGKYYRGLWD